MNTSYHHQVCHSLSEIREDEWQTLNTQQDPFLHYQYLLQLEASQSLRQQHWQPCHQLLYQGDQLIAAMPAYIKHDSYGEFVFDWAWADAAQRAGIRYYPKLVSCIPFAPVTGQRILLHPEHQQAFGFLLDATIDFAKEQSLSSVHILYCQQAILDTNDSYPWLERATWHYQWQNQDYADFDDFLAALNSKRRKQIRKERREVNTLGLSIECLYGDQIKAHHWDAFYPFYCETFQRKWGEPRLTLPFFLALQKLMNDNLLLVLASDKTGYIAGSFSLVSEDTVYGRHWGCSRQYQHLHFELCYYQTIEFCIRQGLQYMDAGIQGEHKIFRGFVPEACYSYHWVAEMRFQQALEHHLQQENQYIHEQIDLLTEHLPYKLTE